MKLDKLVIGMITEGIPFDGETAWKEPLGGSESAFSFMGAELAKRGHRICAFTLTDKSVASIYKEGNRTIYYPLESFNEMCGIFEWDVLIVSRFGHWLSRQFKSRLNVLWNHDILTDGGAFMGQLWKTDLLINNSKFHVDQYLTKQQELDRIMWESKLGVDLEWVDASIQGVQKPSHPRFVYASRPERGLEVLAQTMWPEILKKHPDAELVICGYDVGTARNVPEDYMLWHNEFMHKLQMFPNVQFVGRLAKPEFYRLLAGSTAVLYPTAFPETFCLVALEAQACGTPIITTRDFALTTTVGPNWCLVQPGDGYHKSFLHKIEELLSDQKRYERLVKEGREHATKFQWKDIAADWEAKFMEMFEERWQNNKPQILRRLMYNSDYIVAREYAERENLPDVIEDLNAVTIGGEEVYVPTDQERKDQADSWGLNQRWLMAANLVEEVKAKTFLDVGCGMGSLLTHISSRFDDVQCHGVDFSQVYVDEAKAFVKKHSKNPQNVTIERSDVREGWAPAGGQQFDIVFAGEIMEHLEDYKTFLAQLESWVKPGGRLIVTCPSGPVEAISYMKNGGMWKGLRLHIRHFEFRDIEELVREKDGMRMQIVPFMVSPIDGALCAMWFLTWVVNGKPFGEIDFDRKVMTARPYNRVSFCTIVKNEENNLGRLLASVRPVVDEIIVADTGSTDDTIRIAEKWADTVLRVDPDPDKDGLPNFGWWRNESIKPAKGEWILWGDADEELTYNMRLRKYLDSPLYNGFVIHQAHLCLDFKPVPDVPVRLFRNRMGWKFYGALHEHCEQAMDKPIHPCMILPDSQFAHYGYLTEPMRRSKARHRNIAALQKDLRINPTRRLTKVFVARDYLNMTEWDIEEHGGRFSEQAATFCRSVIEIHLTNFNDPLDLYHKISFELYQRALRYLGSNGYTMKGSMPFEIAHVLMGSPSGIQATNAEPLKRWFLTKKEFYSFMEAQGKLLMDSLTAGPFGY